MKQLFRRRPSPRGVVWQAVPVVIAREDAGRRCSDAEFVEIGRHLPRPLRFDERAGLGAGHSAREFFALPARLAYRSLSEKSPLEESLPMQVRYGRVSGGPCPRRWNAQLVRGVIQNEVLYTVIPAKAGIQCRSICGQVWMPAFAGMTLVSPRRPLIFNDSGN
jgi:hypothetical protein